MTVYGATKAFVQFLSQGLALELGPKGVYVQGRAAGGDPYRNLVALGLDIDSLPEVMEVQDLVDAALVGYDRREAHHHPPLQRRALGGAGRCAADVDGDLRQSQVAERYRAV
jgi:short-subunit dehydrogenase